jgi:D-threonate/D-erythronate kinase
MIAVIADDLTGAAELGGIGLRYNLNVEIATGVDRASTAELLIISADTRSIPEADAVAKIEMITTELMRLQPAWVYKKIDSVLRGHVVAELKVQMKVMQVKRVLVIPANPSLERIIKDKLYYYKGEPIHHSSFATDPEFPVTSSFITDMLRTTSVFIAKHDETLPANGIVVGEVETNNDINLWATKVDDNILLAGAAGFFTALLDSKHVSGNYKNGNEKSGDGSDTFTSPVLFVCGTTFSRSREAIREIKDNGGPVSYMPEQIVTTNGTNGDFEQWSTEVSGLLGTHGKAIIAISEGRMSAGAKVSDLSEKTASVVASVLEKTAVCELVVEGGSTAAAIIHKLGWKKFIPVHEYSPGVIRMKVDGQVNLYLTMKPGSYNWSPELWQF